MLYHKTFLFRKHKIEIIEIKYINSVFWKFNNIFFLQRVLNDVENADESDNYVKNEEENVNHLLIHLLI